MGKLQNRLSNARLWKVSYLRLRRSQHPHWVPLETVLHPAIRHWLVQENLISCHRWRPNQCWVWLWRMVGSTIHERNSIKKWLEWQLRICWRYVMKWKVSPSDGQATNTSSLTHIHQWQMLPDRERDSDFRQSTNQALRKASWIKVAKLLPTLSLQLSSSHIHTLHSC